MLIEKATSLVAEIEQFEKLKASAKGAQALEARVNQLRPAADDLAEAARKLKEIRSAGIAVDFIPREGDGLSKRAADLLAGLRSDPKSIVNPGDELKFQFVDRLSSLASAAESAALAGWKRFVVENSDSAGEEILSALSAVPDYRVVVSRIRAIQGRIVRLASAVPTDARSAMDELKQLVAEHRAAWSEMTAGGIPHAIIHFLRACSAGGARLDSLTEEVEAWLTERNLTHLFTVKLG